MKVVVDANVLVRAAVRDDAVQARVAAKVLTDAGVIALALPCLCEFVWVLRKVYGLQTQDIAAAIRALLAAENVRVNRPAAEAGLWMLEAGGDFADGVIAYEGNWLGGESFVSFDKQAVALLTAAGQPVRTAVFAVEAATGGQPPRRRIGLLTTCACRCRPTARSLLAQAGGAALERTDNRTIYNTLHRTVTPPAPWPTSPPTT